MGTIKIFLNYQGEDTAKLPDMNWQKLLKLENGTFNETSSMITFKTTEGLTITAEKNNIFKKGDFAITYMGHIDNLDEPNVFIDKSTLKNDFYVIRGSHANSFSLTLLINSNLQTPFELPFKIDEIHFLSDNHIRYQNGKIAKTSNSDNQGHNKGALREIQITSNINDEGGYSITIFNLNSSHPLWNDNVQVSKKQMKVISVDNRKIVLRGFGHDDMGESFEDFGLSIYHNGIEPSKIVLHLHNRNIDIEYLKSNEHLSDSETFTTNNINKILFFINTINSSPLNTKRALARNTDELNNIGCDYYREGNINEAIIYFNKALDIYPINDDALRNLITCYNEVNNFKKMQEAQEMLDYIQKLRI